MKKRELQMLLDKIVVLEGLLTDERHLVRHYQDQNEEYRNNLATATSRIELLTKENTALRADLKISVSSGHRADNYIENLEAGLRRQDMMIQAYEEVLRAVAMVDQCESPTCTVDNPECTGQQARVLLAQFKREKTSDEPG